MHRGYNNFSYVIDSSFQPFSMQEMLVPFTAYKDAYEKMEEDYTELSKNASDFDYLSKTLPEGSKARQIYEGYANDLKAQADDLAKNGLGMGNKRALLNMKRRYSGEIGRLRKADEALKQEQALRRQMSAKDPSMLYADDNLNIDSYLDGQTPNLYGISGTDLYTKAAAASQAMSKRQFSVNGQSKTLGGYYYDYIQRMGYTPEQLRQFGDQISADFAAQVSVLPELQQAANQILEANGVTENFKDNPNNLRKAQQQVIRGLIDGAVYSEQHNPQRNLGKMTASEEAADARAREAATRAQQQMELSALQSGYKRENGKWVLDEEGIKKRAEIMGIGSYNPDEWEVGPDGKVRKKAKSTTTQTSEEKTEKKKDAALMELDKTALRNERGFDVEVGNERQHYDYIAALVHNPKQNKWYSGHLGEDFKGHTGPALWSDVNVIDRLGNYSITRWKDKADRRVLAGNEVAALANNKDIANSIEDELVKSNLYTERTIQGVMSEYKLPREKAIEQLEKSGYKYISDYQLVAVKNDKGDDDYLIAVRTK